VLVGVVPVAHLSLAVFGLGRPSPFQWGAELQIEQTQRRPCSGGRSLIGDPIQHVERGRLNAIAEEELLGSRKLLDGRDQPRCEHS